jgi:hypothetical protein
MEVVAMGDMVGVHTEEELKTLSPQQREQLKQQILDQLQTSPEIRKIINEDPQILTSDSRINEVLKRELRPFFDSLKKE